MNGCDPQRISAYYDGELPGWQRREFERHLAECVDCARTLAEYRTIGAGIRALPDVAPPAVIRMRVFSRLPNTHKELGRSSGSPLLFAGGALAMAAVLVITLATLFNGMVERPAAPGRPAETVRQAAPTSPTVDVAMKAEPTAPPAPAASEGRPAAPKPAVTDPATVAKPAPTARPTNAAPAAATPIPTPAAPKPSPTTAVSPTAIAIVQATVAPTPRGLGVLALDPPAVLTPTTAITVTGVISEVVRGHQLMLRAEDGIQWRVGLTTTETITRTDGAMASMNDLRPGLRIGVVGRPDSSVRSLLARVLTILAP